MITQEYFDDAIDKFVLESIEYERSDNYLSEYAVSAADIWCYEGCTKKLAKYLSIDTDVADQISDLIFAYDQFDIVLTDVIGNVGWLTVDRPGFRWGWVAINEREICLEHILRKMKDEHGLKDSQINELLAKYYGDYAISGTVIAAYAYDATGEALYFCVSDTQLAEYLSEILSEKREG